VAEDVVIRDTHLLLNMLVLRIATGILLVADA
jgi:hypothetical protein